MKNRIMQVHPHFDQGKQEEMKLLGVLVARHEYNVHPYVVPECALELRVEVPLGSLVGVWG